MEMENVPTTLLHLRVKQLTEEQKIVDHTIRQQYISKQHQLTFLFKKWIP
jgi:hypothetical protein